MDHDIVLLLCAAHSLAVVFALGGVLFAWPLVAERMG